MLLTKSSVAIVTRLSGPDSLRFLQGQLTCDVASIAPGHWTWAAACTPKGRVVDVFRLYRLEQEQVGQDVFLLICWSADATARLLAHLGKYKVFFNCEFNAHEVECRGAFLTAAADHEIASAADGWLGSSNQIKQDSRNGTRLRAIEVVAGRFDIALQLGSQENSTSQQLEEDEFSALQALFGVPMLDAETSEKFTTHALGLPALGAVSFTKGCFTGQEIVARTQYLGSSKKQPVAFGVLAEGAENPELAPSRFVCVSEDSLDAILTESRASVVSRVRPDGAADGMPAAADRADRLPFRSACLAVLDPEKI